MGMQKKKKVEQRHSRVAFSHLIANLTKWNFIREESDPGYDQEKFTASLRIASGHYLYSARIKKRGASGKPASRYPLKGGM
jgi:hypothetical protein